MWVEIEITSMQKRKLLRHPLREDVSWNLSCIRLRYRVPVILFVRMWVEMPEVTNCFWKQNRHPLREDVSWNLEEYGVNHRCSNMVLLWGGELKYPWSSFSASHEGVTIIHYLIWILNSIIEISEEIFTCVPRKNEQHLVVSLIFIWYLNAG